MSLSCQYTHTLVFVRLHFRRHLVECLVNRFMKICSIDTKNKMLDLIHITSTKIGYARGFLVKHLRVTNKKTAISTKVPKALLLKLQIKRHVVGDVLCGALSRAVKRKFNAVDLCLLYSTRSMLIPQVKDKLHCYATSMCISDFSCFISIILFTFVINLNFVYA